ncbi:hypothetical protein EDB89DRAFT_1909750 [Lactarius sanguifluus]|nr:hypothetical protein EDB89DRAFT_1909750 [Lactarius sanguifluus]
MHAEGHTTHGKGVCEGTRSPAPPFPHDRPAPYAREGGMRGVLPPPPWPPHTRGKGHARARDHRPHPSTMRVEGHTTHGKGAREGTQPPGPPFPRDRTIPEGTRSQPHPSTMHTEGHTMHGKGAREGTRPPAHPFPCDRTAPYAWEGGTQGHATPVPPFRVWGEEDPFGAPPSICHPRPTLPRRAAHAERGTRGQAAPGWWPRSCGKGPASPRVAQRGWRGLGAPVFTAPAPRFSRAMVRLSQKKMDVV